MWVALRCPPLIAESARARPRVTGPYICAGDADGWSKSGSIAAPAVSPTVAIAVGRSKPAAVAKTAPAAAPVVACVIPFMLMKFSPPTQGGQSIGGATTPTSPPWGAEKIPLPRGEENPAKEGGGFFRTPQARTAERTTLRLPHRRKRRCPTRRRSTACGFLLLPSLLHGIQGCW